MELSRRETLLMGATAVALAQPTARAEAPPDRSPRQVPRPLALPFKASGLKGLSEKLLTSHHDNNYVGAWKNLQKARSELSAVGKDTFPGLVAGLRERELTFGNSVVLHELYFGNLGGDGAQSSRLVKMLASTFGSAERLEEQLRAVAMSLSGGSGWVILDWSFQLRELRVSWSGNHTQVAAFGAPLLVLDMYEHSYAMDFGTNAAAYVDAFWRNIHWGEVERRLDRATAMQAALDAA